MLDICSFEVPGRGLEPLRISPPDPKSGASAISPPWRVDYEGFINCSRRHFSFVLEFVLE